MEKTKFNRTYEILNEVFNAVTHGIGTGLSIAGLVVLLVKGAHLHSSLHIVSYAIYGSMMILLFLTSTLFHSLIFTKAKKVFQVFDHSSIFLLIAGSYTPFCLLRIRGWHLYFYGVALCRGCCSSLSLSWNDWCYFDGSRRAFLHDRRILL